MKAKTYRFLAYFMVTHPFYFHVNGSIGIVLKIDFDITPDLGCTTLKTSRKVVLGNPSVCVCPSVCLAVAFPASSHGRNG